MRFNYLLHLFTEKYPNRFFISIVLGASAGFASAGLIPLVMLSLHAFKPELFASEAATLSILFDSFPNADLGLLFLALCGVVLFAGITAKALIEQVRIDVESDLRANFYGRVAASPVQDLEVVGNSRLMTVLTNDIPDITAAVMVIPSLITHTATLIGLLTFLAILKLQMFYFVIITLVVGVLANILPLIIGIRFLAAGREEFVRLIKGTRGLVFGANELKLNREKSREFRKEELLNRECFIRLNQKKAIVALAISGGIGSLMSFFAIGVACFILAYMFSLAEYELLSTTIVLLYISAPVGVIMANIQTIAQAKVPIDMYHRALNQLREEPHCSEFDDASRPITGWKVLSTKFLMYQYRDTEDENSHELIEDHLFSVGPVNIDIEKSQITFIVGGNGSGKTTLGKLLSLLYLPVSGVISFDGVSVDESNRNGYRQGISVIYSDFYLFKKLVGVCRADIDKKAAEYLEDLDLSKKVKVSNGVFSTLKLSSGQRKRLALLVSFLEDRDLYVFDEWAADQDPEFKAVFYEKILTQLKQQGKAVVVITHDDRYFHLADKVIKMESGRVIDIKIMSSMKVA